MRELKIYLSDLLNDRFRKSAMDAFGYGRGSISKAAEEALLQWCEKKNLQGTNNQDDSSQFAQKVESATIIPEASINENTGDKASTHSS